MIQSSIPARLGMASLLVAMAVGAPSSASASPAATAARIVAASPSDAQLAGATDADLVRLAVRCLPIDGMTYCLHWGWDPQGLGSPALQRQATGPADATSRAASTGDAPLTAGLRAWAAKPRAERDAAERAELAEARAAVGKVIYADAVAKAKPLPAGFAARYPHLASWTQRTEAGAVSDAGTLAETFYETIRYDRAKKQEKGHYCGPTSMQAFAWNDPKASLYKSQTYWAGILHTDTNGSTWVYDLKDAINKYTHWDDSDYAGTYVVGSISSWTNTDWTRVLQWHIVTRRAPVQLHPKLSPSVSSYYPGTTSGHFDVGEGWYVNGGTVSIFEPAGGPAQNNIYTSLFATETINNIRLANLANTDQRNIAY
ncbi:cysteine peptidase family C39 domain-containing protein [Micromonospora chersina]|uniref:hypothetical protein n=1 Tax=Micromonospora chersina TaxID=47854 RepID=UPI00370FF8F2